MGTRNPAKFIFLYFLLVIGFVCGIADNGFTQAPAEDDGFTNLGPISYSNDYKLSPESDHITYRIKNKTTLTIDKVFVWIYHTAKGDEGNTTSQTLVNNPHRGGTVIKGKPHRPTTISDWRFPLIKAVPGSEKAGKYTLRISTKSVFYPKVEPPNLKKKSPNQP